ncbi:uncharacterized protein RCO7_03411 [Rhynchosporium graminicola]|uniref:Uncharacterized protein n=1 Tax=Rhynchosporium graminicola TaxID=2792576 RepID=A0A1E1LS98_9HELO|nr:uncharacterized protein RCO7_03411 [Rhynchosporium commune]
MQLIVASIGLFAAVAAASNNTPKHFHARRAYNESIPLTTLTYVATEVETITSCAPSVTNCPVRQSTKTSAYTTVCAKSAASSASSALSSQACASSTARAPIGTGVSTKSDSGYPTGPIGPLSTGASTKGNDVYPTANPSGSVVLTYTIGHGTSTAVITTTIQHTQTATAYEPYPTAPESVSTNNGVPTTAPEPTTTLTGTSTMTRYITVVPAPSSATGVQSVASACVPVTVTVATTITVTAPGTCPVTSTDAGIISAKSAGELTTSAPGVEPYPTETPNSQIVSLSTATVIPVPYPTAAPYGNATQTNPTSTKTKKKCSSIFPSGATHPSGAAHPSGVAHPSGGRPVNVASSSTANGAVNTPPVYWVTPKNPVYWVTPTPKSQGPVATQTVYPVKPEAVTSSSTADAAVATPYEAENPYPRK